MSQNQNASAAAGGGLGCFSCFFLTFLLFLGLKLTNNIDWSWWWVTAPLWGYTLLVAGVIGLALLILMVAVFVRAMKNGN